MILTFFFILTIIIFSSIGLVYAEHFITTTVTVYLEYCEDSQVYNAEVSKCISGGSSEETTPPKFTTSSSSGSRGSGGCGITGVGPDGSHGHGGAFGAIGKDCGRIGVDPSDTRNHIAPHESNTSSYTIPPWVSNVTLWWLDDKITQEEFKNTITYLLDQNIIPNDIPKPDISLGKFDFTTKRIFELWVNGNLQDNYILKIIQDYRQLGIW